MLEFKVRKGLESPLKIHGMLSKFFYIYSVTGGVLGLFTFATLFNVISGSTSFFTFVLTAIVSAAIVMSLRIYFINKSNQKKLNFGKKRIYISNRDLLRSIT